MSTIIIITRQSATELTIRTIHPNSTDAELAQALRAAADQLDAPSGD